MLNHHINPSDNSKTDRIQAACRQIVAQQKEQEAVRPDPSRSNFDRQPAREVVRTALNLRTDDMGALEPGRNTGPRINTASETNATAQEATPLCTAAALSEDMSCSSNDSTASAQQPEALASLEVDEEVPYGEPDFDASDLEPGQGAIGYIPFQVWNPYTGEFILDNRMLLETRDGNVLKETRYRAFGTKQETEPIPANAKLFRCYVAEDMEEAEPIRFLVPDMVMEGGVGLIWGKSGSGKTAFLLDLVLSVATGGDFAGRATQQCNVLYAALEGGHGFRQRLLVGSRHKGLDLGRRVRVCHEPLNVGDDADMNGLALQALQNHCKLIVIDTLSASLAGELSENSNNDMAQVLLKLYRLQRQTGASILLVHHSGHDGSNERGASALRCNVDTSIRISTSGAHRKWTVIKQKDGSDGISDLFDLAQVEVTRNDGQIVNSIVVRHLKTSSETEAAKKTPNGPRLKGNPAIAMDQFSREWQVRSAGLSEDQLTGLAIAWKDAKDICSPLMKSKDRGRLEDRAAEALNRLVELCLLEQQPDKSLRLAQAL